MRARERVCTYGIPVAIGLRKHEGRLLFGRTFGRQTRHPYPEQGAHFRDGEFLENISSMGRVMGCSKYHYCMYVYLVVFLG